MRAILHIVTAEDDALAKEVIAAQSADAQNQVTVADLTKPGADYKALLESIFSADSIQVW
jgi:hypothetical protein